jgi:hypothetical protein
VPLEMRVEFSRQFYAQPHNKRRNSRQLSLKDDEALSIHLAIRHLRDIQPRKNRVHLACSHASENVYAQEGYALVRINRERKSEKVRFRVNFGASLFGVAPDSGIGSANCAATTWNLF